MAFPSNEDGDENFGDDDLRHVLSWSKDGCGLAIASGPCVSSAERCSVLLLRACQALIYVVCLHTPDHRLLVSEHMRLGKTQQKAFFARGQEAYNTWTELLQVASSTGMSHFSSFSSLSSWKEEMNLKHAPVLSQCCPQAAHKQ